MLKKTDPDIIQSYLEDSSALKNGKADCVLIPENESEIIEIVKQASQNKIPTTLSAGKTGTTGGCIPFKGQILSLEKLNKIIRINPHKKTAVCQPGITIENIEKALDKFDLTYPPDPTEKTAFLGGTVATNASGTRSFRFGPTRNWINRLRVVLSTGEVLELKRRDCFTGARNDAFKKISVSYKMPDVKNAAGYYIKPNMDLIDLFIGSEGTLGIITEIEIKLLPKIKNIFECIAFFSSKADALACVSEMKKTKSPLSLEYFDNHSLEHLRPKFSKIPSGAKTAIMFEDNNNNTLEEYAELLEKFNCSIDQAWFAESESERENLRLFRHALPEICNEIFKRTGQTKIATDIAVPDQYNLEMINYYDELLAPSQLEYLYFGHIGDNHVHVNIFPKNEEERKKAKDIYMQFVKKAASLGGTISAEHGIGKIKTEYLKVMYGEKAIGEMKEIKRIFDPAYILNPGNIFQP